MSCLSSSRLIALIWFVGFAYVATRLPDAELTALSVVLTKLGKSDWKPLEVDPCTNQSPWWNQTSRGGSGVYCNCTTQITTCHVTRIILKEMNLTGSLPQELVGLSFLEEIDLTRNYLNGTIPPQWGSMQSLKIISLLGNRLDGQIPKELANITALVDLVLEANKFNGSIPSEFGNLTNIQRLLLSSNYLTGPIPPTLAKLTTLTQFRISDNNFTGTIPEFIQNWINVERIEIQASGLTGPIPANLTSLTNLTDLRISDLNGSVSKFPNLSVSKTWDNLILRSCNIEGEIPRSIAGMDIDDNLDLSFNKFTGPIPPGVGDLRAGRM